MVMLQWCSSPFWLLIDRQKYIQNAIARGVLMSTGKKIAEASRGKVWGIGYSLDDPDKNKSMTWGDNLQGKVLMAVKLEFEEKLAAQKAKEGANPKPKVT